MPAAAAFAATEFPTFPVETQPISCTPVSIARWMATETTRSL
jgi:hypothetical protein